jgi:hypothetical protein
MSDGKMSLRDTITPKSDQLNYEDFINGPMTVRVAGLAAGSAEQPVRVRVVDAATGAALRDFVPCKTMRRVLIAAWGDKGKDWVGQRATLYGDGGVKFGGVEVGKEPLRLKLSTARAKRAEVVIGVLPEEGAQ